MNYLLYGTEKFLIDKEVKNIISKKETFLWTINEYKDNIDKFYIITDTPYIFFTKDK